MTPLKVGMTCVAAALAIAAPLTLAQTYPSKPIRLVVPYAPGGSGDTLSRIIAQKLAVRFGQPVIVENRPGAEAIIGTDAVAQAVPDGYTILCTAGTAITVLPHTRRHLPYDPFNDFVHLSQTAYTQFALAVNPSVSAGNIAELVALARSRPGQLTYASMGGVTQFTSDMFKVATRTDILGVQYKGAAPATTDLLSGQVNMMFAVVGNVVPYFKAGKLKVLAVTGERRSPNLPNVPTMAEAGVADFESSGSYGISAPKGTPAEIVKKLHSEISAVVRTPDTVHQVLAWGMEARSSETPEAYTAFLRAEFAKFRVLAQQIGIKPE